MPSSSRVDVFHGPTGTPSAVAWTDGARFHRADSSPTTDGATVFIPIPTSGTNYSWRKHFKLNVTDPPTGSISNLRFYSDGTSWGTGVTALAAKSSTYTQGSSADNTTPISGGTNVTTYTAGSPLVVNAGTVLTATTGYGTQDYVVMQVGGTSSVSTGTTTPRTMYYSFDET